MGPNLVSDLKSGPNTLNQSLNKSLVQQLEYTPPKKPEDTSKTLNFANQVSAMNQIK